MKNAIVLFLALILVFAASGCSSKEDSPPQVPSGGTGAVVSVAVNAPDLDLKSAFETVSEGQTKEEIIKLLGEPLEKQQTPKVEYWYYEKSPDVLQIAFDSGTVSAKRLY